MVTAATYLTDIFILQTWIEGTFLPYHGVIKAFIIGAKLKLSPWFQSGPAYVQGVYGCELSSVESQF